jgi:lipopolysaccharide export system permease protein
MGSIDRYIFRTTLASLALIPVCLAEALRITQALGGVDPMTGQSWMIPTFRGIDSRVIPAFAIGKPNARLLRLLGRPFTA